MKTITQIALAILVFALVVIIKQQLASDKRIDRLEKQWSWVSTNCTITLTNWNADVRYFNFN